MTVFAQNKKWQDVDGILRLNRMFRKKVAVFCKPFTCLTIADVKKLTGEYDVVICDFSTVLWFRLMEAAAAKKKWVKKILIENKTQDGDQALFNARGRRVREDYFAQAVCAKAS